MLIGPTCTHLTFHSGLRTQTGRCGRKEDSSDADEGFPVLAHQQIAVPTSSSGVK